MSERRFRLGLNQPMIVALVLLVLVGTIALAFVLQHEAERNALTPAVGARNILEQRQVDKLDAEIRQIRSDTSGSLFWLKMAGLFVTVGAAVGGYLVGQSRSSRERAEAERRVNQERLEFEHRQSVDATYHSIVQELTDPSPVLRAASAMKLGKLLEAAPVEWHVAPERWHELVDLTNQILAAALAIEKEPKVLKALTIALALHDPAAEKADLSYLDLSGASAADAYWARMKFNFTDFYRADLRGASFRKAELQDAQFRESILRDAVLVEAKCERANFKLADLRGADFSGADLRGAKFEEVKVHGMKLEGAVLGDNDDFEVDVSPDGDGSERVRTGDWLARAAA